MTLGCRDQWSTGVENQHPDAIVAHASSQRRPLKQVNGEGPLLSPTKRPRHSTRRDAVRYPLKLAEADSRERVTCQTGGWQSPGNALLEVLTCLGKRDIIEVSAPVCRAWRDVAQGAELWAILGHRVRLIDQLVVVEKIVERRSKGKLLKCRQLGTGESCLLRVVNLALSNAGRDDGVPTSFLRETALLKRLRHPNIVRLFGAEVHGINTFTCTEYVSESFATWHRGLEGRSRLGRLTEIRFKFCQLLTGLSFLHRQGIMHRNLKPDNIFLDQLGNVKLGDFTTSRMLDVPFQAYTPEDPKERDSSGREMRRLWYRAPEVLLRDEIYSSKVDMWAVGCLFAEAAAGKPLFSSESEIDHLFRVFRLVGTPTAASWPEVVTMKNFSPMFPLHAGFDLAQIARAVCCASGADRDELRIQSRPDRSDVLQHAASVVTCLGLEGTFALDRLLKLRPEYRADADEVLASPFFACSAASADAADLDPLTSCWLQGKACSQDSEKQQQLQGAKILLRSPRRPSAQLSVSLGKSVGDGDSCSSAEFPPFTVQPGLIPPHQAWSIVHAMQQRERDEAGGLCAVGSGCTCPPLPPGFAECSRSAMIDFIVHLSSFLTLTDYTLHIAARVVDRYLAQEKSSIADSQLKLLAATCLKIADAFAEQSKEYYKQESAQEYSEAAMGEISQQQLVECEKAMLPKVCFDIWTPTVHWFTQCFLAYGRFSSGGATAKFAVFIGDLTLLDYDVLMYTASLRAQCALVIAAFLASDAERKSARGSRMAVPTRVMLQWWDEHVREHVCFGNTELEATMCLKAVVRILVEKRREWKSLNLTCVETKHQGLVRGLVYPETFPTSQLAKHIIPACPRD